MPITLTLLLGSPGLHSTVLVGSPGMQLLGLGSPCAMTGPDANKDARQKAIMALLIVLKSITLFIAAVPDRVYTDKAKIVDLCLLFSVASRKNLPIAQFQLTCFPGWIVRTMPSVFFTERSTPHISACRCSPICHKYLENQP